MSNLRKRFLALAIVAVMLVAALSSTAFAATSEFADISDAEETKMVKLLSALQIVLGRPADEDGVKNFDRDALVNRQEMAMFLARINSATPGAFNDAEAAAAAKIAFEDVTDSTFFLAIQYCHEQGIITGATAETFNPTDTVTLDQALAMIIRALGYKDIDTSKNFIESTKKAKELGFALTYKDNEGGKKLTRIEVISLLYKYFYSNEQSLEIVKNEFTGVQSVQRVPHPVMEKFGISVNEAYIVKSNEYTAAMSTVTLDTPNGDKLTLPAISAPALSPSDIAAGRTIVLAYNNYKVVSTSATTDSLLNGEAGKYIRTNGYTYTGKWSYITIRPDELQELPENYTNREIVGLKVVYYQDTMANTRPEALGVLSYVKGTRTPIELADMSSNMKDTLNDGFSDFSKALTILDVTYDLTTNYGRARDLSDGDVYQFNNTTNLSAGSSSSISTLTEIGGFIKQKGYFTLDYVVNDTNEKGEVTESYFVYTPYKAGYYEKDDDGRYVILNGSRSAYHEKDLGGRSDKDFLKFNDADSSYNYKPVFAADAGATALTKGEAYLFTVEGRNLYIFKKLYMQVNDAYPEYIVNDAIKFANIDSISIKSNNSKIAAGASTAVGSFSIGSKHRAFSYDKDSKAFFVVRTDGDPINWNHINNNYGVLTAAPTGAPAYLSSGTKYLWTYRVYTYENGSIILMNSEYNVTDYDYYNSRVLEAGLLVSWQKVGDYYRLGAFDANHELYSNTNGWAKDNEYTTYVPFTNNTMRINGVTGIVDGSTQILVAEYTNNIGLGVGDPKDYAYARKFTKAEFDTWLSTYGWDSDTMTIEMITNIAGSPSVAKAILVSIPYMATLDNNGYVTITNVLGNGYGNGTFALGEGYNYKTGNYTKVAVSGGTELKLGDVVRLTNDTLTFYNTQYQRSTRANNTPLVNHAAVPYLILNNKINDPAWNQERGTYTQPSNLMSALTERVKTGRSDLLLGGLDEYLADFGAYPIFDLNPGYVSSITTATGLYLAVKAFTIWEITLDHASSADIVYYSFDELSSNDKDLLEGAHSGYTVISCEPTEYSYDVNEVISVDDYDDLANTNSITSTGFVTVNGTTALFALPGTDDPLIDDAEQVQTAPTLTAAMDLRSVDNDILVLSIDSAPRAVSLLNGKKLNYLVIKTGATSTSGNMVGNTTIDWGHRDDKVRSYNDTFGGGFYIEDGKLDGRDYADYYDAFRGTYQWYVITNNVNSYETSDVVTIIKVINP